MPVSSQLPVCSQLPVASQLPSTSHYPVVNQLPNTGQLQVSNQFPVSSQLPSTSQMPASSHQLPVSSQLPSKDVATFPYVPSCSEEINSAEANRVLDELQQEFDDLYGWDRYDDLPDDQKDSNEALSLNGSKCSCVVKMNKPLCQQFSLVFLHTHKCPNISLVNPTCPT